MSMQQRDEPRYQHLKKIADLLDWAGDLAGAEFAGESREAYALARKFHDRADALGAPAPDIHTPN
ncbi:hypothetical protein [Arthrobacter globiformis]|uniref:Uncharacterized protein n=1 Tax=Arthrobacter globiformis TaxID=1665 RepID=A0A328HCT1_ARTGO|nr:hypothetical protein [Arthrobacter globiformis]RAM36397.1 hypothetical protein DBZ45_15875 [Arthrobacter globiformis]